MIGQIWNLTATVKICRLWGYLKSRRMSLLVQQSSQPFSTLKTVLVKKTQFVIFDIKNCISERKPALDSIAEL